MRNDTNKIKYRRLAPLYDKFMGNAMFRQAREHAFALHPFTDGSNVLLAGVGTGEDLAFLPNSITITGIDLSKDMLDIAAMKAEGKNVKLLEMNAERLSFDDEVFDGVILNLILSVAEHPRHVLTESLRTLKPAGTIIVFDKFLETEQPSFTRKVLNRITSTIGTNINRRFEDIIDGAACEIIKKESSLFRGSYQIFLLKKTAKHVVNN